MTEVKEFIDCRVFCDYELDGIDTKDYPDFTDAFIVSANVKEGDNIREATQEELDELNNDSCFINELVYTYIF